MGTGADITSTGAHPQYERCPPAIITGANTYKYSAERLDIKHVWGIPAHSRPWYLPNNLLRECLALVKAAIGGTI